uniref:Uncharacterized protein n=1 Tax=Anguilla anguilla TaxID=7936 RepID=A0A0E9UHG8_ANGAN
MMVSGDSFLLMHMNGFVLMINDQNYLGGSMVDLPEFET